MKREKLLEYAKRVEAGEAFDGDDELDFYEALGVPIEVAEVDLQRCLSGGLEGRGSLDECLFFHESSLPDWKCTITSTGTVRLMRDKEVSAHVDGDPGRAWLAAILRASAEDYP